MTKVLLLIEDDKILLEMYKTLFLNHGYDVHTAVDGVDGLEKALRDHPDLILLDIRMPKMDGMTVLKHLRADKWGKNAKVILLTNIDPTDNILQDIVLDHPTYYLIKANTNSNSMLERIKEVLEEKTIKN